MARRKLPYMRMYWDHYTVDTGHLSVAEHGAYLLIMRAYWQKQMPPTESEARGLSLMSSDAWLQSRDTLAAFFRIAADGRWKHKRVDAELKRVHAVSKANSKAGSAGGKRSGESRREAKTKRTLQGESKRTLSEREANAKPQQIDEPPTETAYPLANPLQDEKLHRDTGKLIWHEQETHRLRGDVAVRRREISEGSNVTPISNKAAKS